MRPVGAELSRADEETWQIYEPLLTMLPKAPKN